MVQYGKTALDWAKQQKKAKCVAILEAAITEQVRQPPPPQVIPSYGPYGHTSLPALSSPFALVHRPYTQPYP